MLKNDYIMRMIEQLTAVMAHVAGLKRSMQYEEAIDLIDESMKSLTGLSWKNVETLTYEELTYFLNVQGSVNPAKYFALAILLKEQGELCVLNQTVSTHGSYNCYLKSLRFFMDAVENSDEEVTKGFLPEIEEVIGRLNAYQLPDHVQYQLIKYYELTGRYSKCEDLIFDMIEAENAKKDADKQDAVQAGIAFYNRLLHKPEDELENGNLPLDEVMEGLERLQNKQES